MIAKTWNLKKNKKNKNKKNKKNNKKKSRARRTRRARTRRNNFFLGHMLEALTAVQRFVVESCWLQATAVQKTVFTKVFFLHLLD